MKAENRACAKALWLVRVSFEVTVGVRFGHTGREVAGPGHQESLLHHWGEVGTEGLGPGCWESLLHQWGEVGTEGAGPGCWESLLYQ